MDSAKNRMRHFSGIATSPGIAVGRLRVIERHHLPVSEYEIESSDIALEIVRLEQAIEKTCLELSALKEQLQSTTGDEHLFFIDTHLLILSDKRLHSETVAHIEQNLINAEAALHRTLHKYSEFFAGMDDAYLRERISDVETVIEKVLRNMVGQPHAPITTEDSQTIIAAHDFSPADILQMDRSRIVGIITEVGGKTSHASILARAFEIPAVAGVEGIADLLLDDVPLILDGLDGTVVLSPDHDTFVDYLERARHYKTVGLELLKIAALPAETLDGQTLLLKGNVEIPDEVATVLRYGGEGVGLYRTEMLFMNRSAMPDEEEQYLVYRTMQQAVAPYPLTIRTLDAGGDKLLEGGSRLAEQNPALGMRAIRLALSMPAEFKKQLRAILRVSSTGTVRIMFPMISGVEELRAAKALLAECKQELDCAGIPYDADLQVGIMIEVPSAVMVSDLLAVESDFFSIGTNDLIQYTLAIDRSNEHLVDLYQPLHPAVLRSLQRVVQAAHGAGISACICGEMAGDPLYLPVLLGLGFDELSMSAASIPPVKKMLRSCRSSVIMEIVTGCLKLDSSAEIEKYLSQEIKKTIDDSF